MSPFKSDEQRKAIFANMFNREGKRSRVSSSNVTNFEVKTTKIKTQKFKSLNFSYKPVVLKDVKTKGGKEFCITCKRKGLSLSKGKCKVCTKEFKSFKQPGSKGRKTAIASELRNNIDIISAFHQSMHSLKWAWIDWLNGPETREEDIEPAREEVKNYLIDIMTRNLGIGRVRTDGSGYSSLIFTGEDGERVEERFFKFVMKTDELFTDKLTRRTPRNRVTLEMKEARDYIRERIHEVLVGVDGNPV